MDITKVSVYTKGYYAKAPETASPPPTTPELTPASIVVTDVVQFQSAVQAELHRVDQNWAQLLPRSPGYRGTLIFNLGTPDAEGNRHIVSIRIILTERSSSAHDFDPPGDSSPRDLGMVVSEYSQQPIRQMLNRELPMLAHPEQFVFPGGRASRIVVYFAIGLRIEMICQ